MIGPDHIGALLDPNPPPDQPESGTAAVAVVFRRAGDAGTEMLFIQRAEREGDPWSAQMAFPGGRREPQDASLAATAERETGEEVGLDLRHARKLGTLATIDGGQAARRPIRVAAFCYWLAGQRPSLRPNEEVADTVWVPLAELTNPARSISYYYPRADADFPGIQLDIEAQVIWGLTLRFLTDLFNRLDHHAT